MQFKSGFKLKTKWAGKREKRANARIAWRRLRKKAKGRNSQFANHE